MPQTQAHTLLEPAIASHTEKLMDNVEKLRTHFGMAMNLPMAAVIGTATERLGLVAHLEGANLVVKADACIAALATLVAAAQVQPVVMMAEPMGMPMAEPMAPQMGVPVAQEVDEQALMAEAKMREAEARIREAEQRARQAEAALRLQEAEMKARAAEQVLAQQSRMAALEKTLRDAMPGWFGVWTEWSTATLQTAIAQAEAAFPPEGSSLQAALLEAKAAMRSQEEATARKEAEARREAEERTRREAEERAWRNVRGQEVWSDAAAKSGQKLKAATDAATAAKAALDQAEAAEKAIRPKEKKKLAEAKKAVDSCQSVLKRAQSEVDAARRRAAMQPRRPSKSFKRRPRRRRM